MAQEIIFNGRRIILPGSYSTIKSGVNNPPQSLDYGRILVIDTGVGAGFGGGSGINGAVNSGVDAVYQFENVLDYQAFLKGGILYQLARPLFKPNGQDIGASTVFHVRAATTTAATVSFAPTGGGTNGGNFSIRVKVDEGVIANGVETNSKLVKGYAYTFEAGVVDPTAFRLRFWRGTWTGNHTDGLAFNEVPQADTEPEELLISDEFTNVTELNAWMDSDPFFNTYFEKVTFTLNGTGAIDSADLTAISGNQLFAGGTETYGANDLTSVFDVIRELDFSFILTTDSGANAQNSRNSAILSHIQDPDTKFEKFMVVAGGADSTEFAEGVTNSSIETAKFFNSDKVIVVHGAPLTTSDNSPSGFRNFGTIYKAAAVLGRIAGLAPQVPVTYKAIDIGGEAHNLTLTERRQAIRAGVLITYFDRDFREFIVEQGINSLQNNNNLINANGTSYSIQLRRITSQINKELIQNSKLQLLNQENGVNRNTLSARNVEDWVKGYLQRITATATVDNLILSFQDITVTTEGDAYRVRYGIIVNREVNKLLFTGFILG